MSTTKTRGKKAGKNEALKIVAITMSAKEEKQLQRLARQMADEIGRGVSRSAVLRALVRLAAKTPAGGQDGELRAEVEREIPLHRWGKAPARIASGGLLAGSVAALLAAPKRQTRV